MRLFGKCWCATSRQQRMTPRRIKLNYISLFSLTRPRPAFYYLLFVNASHTLTLTNINIFEIAEPDNGGSVDAIILQNGCMSWTVQTNISMPRLIRRRPLLERVQAYLNPLDFLLWLSEELDSSDWDHWQQEWATTVGVALNVIFLAARANSGPSERITGGDVFGEGGSHTAWLAWLVRPLGISTEQYSRLMRCRQLLSSTSCHSYPS